MEMDNEAPDGLASPEKKTEAKDLLLRTGSMIWRSWNLCIAESDLPCFFGRSWLEFEEEEDDEDEDDSEDDEDYEDMSEFETCVDLNMCQVMQT